MGVSFHDLVIENLDTKSISIRIHAAKISLSCAISWDKREKKCIIYCFLYQMNASLVQNYHLPFVYGLFRGARYNGGTRMLF